MDVRAGDVSVKEWWPLEGGHAMDSTALGDSDPLGQLHAWGPSSGRAGSWLWECDLPRYHISDLSQAVCTLMERKVLFLSRGAEEVSGYLGRKKRKGVRVGWLSGQGHDSPGLLKSGAPR